MSTPLVQTTGRRKGAVARVRVRPGTGTITVNDRDDRRTTSRRETHRMILTEPLRLTEHRRGLRHRRHAWTAAASSGQAGALRLGIARALVELDPELRTDPQAGRLPHARRPREGVEEVRPQEGPQGAAVLQALSSPRRPAMTLRFGTDGVRGVANVELTPELALALGRAAARVLGGDRYAVGRDTRRSGPAARGRARRRPGRRGCRRHRARRGAHPRGGVAGRRPRTLPAAMVSASHNPFADNGIKLFAPAGASCPTTSSGASRPSCSASSARSSRATPPPRRRAHRRRGGPHPAGRGRRRSAPRLRGRRGGVARRPAARRAVASWSTAPTGRRRAVAPAVLARPGRRRPRAARPARRHQHQRRVRLDPPRGARRGVVVEHGADVGLAFDGDADRVLAVDAAGALVDGDQLIAMCAVDRHERGTLPGDTVVVTVMTNLGFRLAMDEHGIAVVETAVGDRYVLEALEARGLVARRRAVRARDLPRPGHHRRRPAHRGAGRSTSSCASGRPLAELAARDDPAAAGAAQRPGGPARSRPSSSASPADIAAVEGRPRRARTGPRAPQRHRAAGPGDGRGADRGRGRGGGGRPGAGRRGPRRGLTAVSSHPVVRRTE